MELSTVWTILGFCLLIFIIYLLSRPKPCPGCGARKVRRYNKTPVGVSPGVAQRLNLVYYYQCIRCGAYYDISTGKKVARPKIPLV